MKFDLYYLRLAGLNFMFNLCRREPPGMPVTKPVPSAVAVLTKLRLENADPDCVSGMSTGSSSSDWQGGMPMLGLRELCVEHYDGRG